MCSAAPSIGKVRRFNVRFQGIAGIDGPVAGPHRSRSVEILCRRGGQGDTVSV